MALAFDTTMSDDTSVGEKHTDSVFKLEDCMFSFSPSEPYDNCGYILTKDGIIVSSKPQRAHDNLELQVVYPAMGGRPIGSLRAHIIFRTTDKEGSLSELLKTHGIPELESLFDSRGFITPCLAMEGFRRGTGCWGTEMNEGQIVYIDRMEVVEQFRSRGIGSAMLKSLVHRGFVGHHDFLICSPSLAVQHVDELPKEKAVSFFKKFGFRRIGCTSFLAYSPDSWHPSRHVDVTSDATEVLPLSESDPETERSLSYDEFGHNLMFGASDDPVYHAITKYRGREVKNMIIDIFSKDPLSIHKCDPRGFSPVHVAFMNLNTAAVDVLLSLGAGSQMRNANNIDGVTPFGYLAGFLEENYTLKTRKQFEQYKIQQLARFIKQLDNEAHGGAL